MTNLIAMAERDFAEPLADQEPAHPLEAQFPLDSRTGDYVRIAGRDYRRERLGPEWILERFPA